MKKLRFEVISLALALLLMLTLAGCSGGGGTNEMSTDAVPPAAASTGAAQAAGGSDLTVPDDDRKITVTAYMTIETLEFDKTRSDLLAILKESGGRTSHTYVNSGDIAGTRSANYTMLVPVKNYSSFIEKAEKTGNMLSLNEQSEDVTGQYFDVEARLRSLKAQEERLLAMMEEASTLENIIKIQDQLTEVQYQIDLYQSHQNALDEAVSYSTVHITITEVAKVTEAPKDSYLDQIADAFGESWDWTGRFFKALGLIIVLLLPWLLIALVVVFVVLFFVRKARKRRAQRAASEPPKAKENTPAKNAGYPYAYPGYPAYPYSGYPQQPAPQAGQPQPAPVQPAQTGTPGAGSPPATKDDKPDAETQAPK